jgi:hypothetical protein
VEPSVGCGATAALSRDAETPVRGVSIITPFRASYPKDTLDVTPFSFRPPTATTEVALAAVKPKSRPEREERGLSLSQIKAEQYALPG